MKAKYYSNWGKTIGINQKPLHCPIIILMYYDYGVTIHLKRHFLITETENIMQSFGTP